MASAIRMDADALNAFMAEAFPHSEPGSRGHVVAAAPGHIQARIDPNNKALRPGGLISGPTQMGFADMAAYALVLAHIGPVAMAVTPALVPGLSSGTSMALDISPNTGLPN